MDKMLDALRPYVVGTGTYIAVGIVIVFFFSFILIWVGKEKRNG